MRCSSLETQRHINTANLDTSFHLSKILLLLKLVNRFASGPQFPLVSGLNVLKQGRIRPMSPVASRKWHMNQGNSGNNLIRVGNTWDRLIPPADFSFHVVTKWLLWIFFFAVKVQLFVCLHLPRESGGNVISERKSSKADKQVMLRNTRAATRKVSLDEITG